MHALHIMMIDNILMQLLAVVVVKFRNEAEQNYKILFLRRRLTYLYTLIVTAWVFLRKALHRAYKELVPVHETELEFTIFLKLMQKCKPELG